MEELIYLINWEQVKTAFDIFMWGDPNFHVTKAGLDPSTWVAIGSAVVSAASAGGAAIKANKRRKEWMEKYEKRMAEIDALEITNPYENLTNPYEDITVNQQQAEFQSQQQQQGLATSMRALRPAAGSSGAAALAQSIANQQTRNLQQSSASIGLQEAANQKMIAGGQMSIQMAEAQGEDMIQARKHHAALAKAGMAQAEYGNAQARADQAVGNLGYAVGQSVGEISGSLAQVKLDKEMDALKKQLNNQSKNPGGNPGTIDGVNEYPGGVAGKGVTAGEIVDINSTLPTHTNETLTEIKDRLDQSYINGGVGSGNTNVTNNTGVTNASVVVRSHTVLKGETLYSLARKYNTSEAEIKRLNNLPSDAIGINDVLTIEDKN